MVRSIWEASQDICSTESLAGPCGWFPELTDCKFERILIDLVPLFYWPARWVLTGVMKISKKHHVFFIRFLFLCYWLYVNRLGVAPLVSYDVGRLRCSFPITLAQTGFFSLWHCPTSVAPGRAVPRIPTRLPTPEIVFSLCAGICGNGGQVRAAQPQPFHSGRQMPDTKLE